MTDTPSALHARAKALKASGQRADAIDVYQELTRRAPNDRIAWHNLASTLGDAGRHDEADAAARQAQRLGLNAGETWLVRARSLMALGRFEDAAAAFRETLARKPADPTLHREFAQFVWMRTGDRAQAVERFQAALAAHPDDLALRLALAHVLRQTGDGDGGLALTLDAARRAPRSALVLTAAAFAALAAGAVETGLDHARRAADIAPQDNRARLALVQALLAAGAAREAAEAAQDLRQRTPRDQYVIALQATAWRLLGDPRYEALYDYDRVVRAQPLTPPRPWPSVAAYVADLAAALTARHAFTAHPFDQSVKGAGSQLTHIEAMDDPALQAWPQAVAGPVRAYAQSLGAAADDPRLSDAGLAQGLKTWSVRLAAGGWHTNHVHPAGWMSSACHILVPPTLAHGPDGWLKFGEPGVATTTPLEAEYWVRPEAGVIVLFPSYVWHGVAPVSGDAPRITIAMDVAQG